MQIKIIKSFKSKILGQCEADSIVTCEPTLGKYIIASRLGEEIEEVATTKDIPIAPRIRRKKKHITGKKVETAAIEVET